MGNNLSCIRANRSRNLDDSSNNVGSRLDRFDQVSQDGITLYTSQLMGNFFLEYHNLPQPTGIDSIVSILKSDLKANINNVNLFWKKAEAKFKDDASKYRRAVRMAGVADYPDVCHIALLCYTYGNGDISFYSLFNKDLRDVCAGKKELKEVPNRSIIFLLLFVMMSQGNRMKSDIPDKVYRGCSGETLCLSPGSKIGFGQFTSTSLDEKTAIGFSESNNGSIFYVELSDKNPNFIDLTVHSFYPNEKEYLFSPMQIYTVKECRKQSNTTIVTLETFETSGLSLH